jgi:hypothetical protein
MAAYRSALEVYTRKAFPADYKEVLENLTSLGRSCERLKPPPRDGDPNGGLPARCPAAAILGGKKRLAAWGWTEYALGVQNPSQLRG